MQGLVARLMMTVRVANAELTELNESFSGYNALVTSSNLHLSNGCVRSTSLV